MDGLTLNASLCAAEMCDLAEHRSIHLQGRQGFARNERCVNHEMARTNGLEVLAIQT